MSKEKQAEVPESSYQKLVKIDPSKAITKKLITSKKPGVKPFTLSYLSWVDAYHTIMSLYPNATFTIKNFPYMNPSWEVVQGYEVPYLMTPQGCFVEVQISLWDFDGSGDDNSKSCMLPVMDHNHNAVKEPDARQISDAIQRALAKCAALHGFGLQVYSKEDLKHIGEEPENGTPEKSETKPLQKDDLSDNPPEQDDVPMGDAPEHDPDKVSEGQIRLIYARGKAAGLTADEVNFHLKDKHGLDSIKDTPWRLKDKILEEFQAMAAAT